MVDSKTAKDAHVCTDLVVSRGHEVCVSCGKVAAVSVLDSDVPEYSDQHAFVSASQTVLEPSGLSTVMGRVNGKREPLRPGSLFTATEVRQIKAIERARDESSGPEQSRGAIASMFDHLAAVERNRGALPPAVKAEPKKVEDDGQEEQKAEKKKEKQKARKPRKSNSVVGKMRAKVKKGATARAAVDLMGIHLDTAKAISKRRPKDKKTVKIKTEEKKTETNVKKEEQEHEDQWLMQVEQAAIVDPQSPSTSSRSAELKGTKPCEGYTGVHRLVEMRRLHQEQSRKTRVEDLEKIGRVTVAWAQARPELQLSLLVYTEFELLWREYLAIRVRQNTETRRLQREALARGDAKGKVKVTRIVYGGEIAACAVLFLAAQKAGSPMTLRELWLPARTIVPLKLTLRRCVTKIRKELVRAKVLSASTADRWTLVKGFLSRYAGSSLDDALGTMLMVKAKWGTEKPFTPEAMAATILMTLTAFRRVKQVEMAANMKIQRHVSISDYMLPVKTCIEAARAERRTRISNYK